MQTIKIHRCTRCHVTLIADSFVPERPVYIETGPGGTGLALPTYDNPKCIGDKDNG